MFGYGVFSVFSKIDNSIHYFYFVEIFVHRPTEQLFD